MHHHLFQDCYEWAGKFRDVDMYKPNSLYPDKESVFCPYDEVDAVLAHAQVIHDEFIANGSEMTLEEQVTELARIHATLNYAHPFREGNGRTTREVMSLNAAEVGLSLDWEGARGETMEFVSALSMAARNHHARPAKPV